MLDPVGLRLPLEENQFSDTQLARLASAQQILATGCMRRFGLRCAPVANKGRSLVRSRTARRCGLADPGQARAHGYRLRADGTRPVSRPALPDDQVMVLEGRGVGDGACWRGTAWGRRAARWSAYLEKRGHAYDDLWQAINDKAFLSPGPTPREIATAVADVACTRETNLVGFWYAVDAAYQKRMLATAGEQRLEALKESSRTSKRPCAPYSPIRTQSTSGRAVV